MMHGHGGGPDHFDPNHLLSMEQRRSATVPPETILKNFITHTNLKLVDLGCGAGYFTLPAARLLPDGKVYAIDRQPDMVETTLTRAKTEGLTNVEGMVAEATKLPLEDDSVDAVFMSMMFHDVADQSQLLAEIKRVVKPGGTIYLVEMDVTNAAGGPPMHLRIRPDALRYMLETAGFHVLDVDSVHAQTGLYAVHATRL